MYYYDSLSEEVEACNVWGRWDWCYDGISFLMVSSTVSVCLFNGHLRERDCIHGLSQDKRPGRTYRWIGSAVRYEVGYQIGGRIGEGAWR